MRHSPRTIGFFQAVGVVSYISLFAAAVQMAADLQPSFFGQPGPAAGIIIFLLLFVVSAAVCGAMFLGYPVILLYEGKKEEAVKTVLWGIFWLVVLAIVVGLLFFSI